MGVRVLEPMTDVLIRRPRDDTRAEGTQLRGFLKNYKHWCCCKNNGTTLLVFFNQKSKPHVTGRETRYLQTLLWCQDPRRAGSHDKAGRTARAWRLGDASVASMGWVSRGWREVATSQGAQGLFSTPRHSLVSSEREHGSAYTFISDSEPPGEWGNTFLWSFVTQFMVFCYGNQRKLILLGLSGKMK